MSATDARIGGGAIEHDVQVDRRRNRRFQLRECGANAIHGVDNVRARLPKNNDQDGGLAICEPSIADVFDRVLHIGDVAESTGAPSLYATIRRAVFIGA